MLLSATLTRHFFSVACALYSCGGKTWPSSVPRPPSQPCWTLPPSHLKVPGWYSIVHLSQCTGVCPLCSHPSHWCILWIQSLISLLTVKWYDLCVPSFVNLDQMETIKGSLTSSGYLKIKRVHGLAGIGPMRSPWITSSCPYTSFASLRLPVSPLVSSASLLLCCFPISLLSAPSDWK